MKYLVIDERFGTPIHVFLENHPGTADDFPSLEICAVDLETLPENSPGRFAFGVGQDPYNPRKYREFLSDRAVVVAGFGLIEPRFVGSSWGQYEKAYRPEGGSSSKGHRKKAH